MKNFNELLQLCLPLLSEAPRPKFLDQVIIDSLIDYGTAIQACIKHRVRKLTEAEIANCLGFKPPHLNKVKQGRGYLSSEQETVLQYLCSNWAVRQYSDRRQRQMAALIESPAEKAMRIEVESELMRRVA